MLNYGGEQNMTLLVLLVWKTTFFLVWKSPQIPRVDVSDSNWRKSIEFKEWRNQGYLSTLCGKLIHITPLLDISGLTLKERYATTLRETFWSGKVLSLVAPFIDFIALFFDLANSDWWTNHPFPTLFLLLQARNRIPSMKASIFIDWIFRRKDWKERSLPCSF